MSEKLQQYLEAVQARADAATPDWCSGVPETGRLFASGHGAEIAHFHEVGYMSYPREANVRFAIGARTDVPRLLRLVRALMAERFSGETPFRGSFAELKAAERATDAVIAEIEAQI
jgi:hypothetical protein